MFEAPRLVCTLSLAVVFVDTQFPRLRHKALELTDCYGDLRIFLVYSFCYLLIYLFILN